MSKAKITELDRIFGANIRRYRHERNLTQEQLAEAAGISISHCANIEAGRNSVTLDTLKRLAGALEVTVDALLTEDGAYSSEIAAQNLAALVMQMSEESAIRAEKLIRFLREEGMLT